MGFLMSLRRMESDFGGVGNIVRKFHKYLEGFLLRSMMPDFKKYVRKSRQEEIADGSLEDWRLFWRSLGHSELPRVSF